MDRLSQLGQHMQNVPSTAPSAAAGKKYRAAVVGLGMIGSGDDVSGAAIGQATLGEPYGGAFHSGSYASLPERVELVCGSSRNAGRRERFERPRASKTSH